jgi:hypothetical protein
MWPPVLEAWQSSGWGIGQQIGPFALPRLLPLLAGFLGLLAGMLCLAGPSAAASATAGVVLSQPSAVVSSGLMAVVKELRTVLADERSKADAFQEVCSANTREVRIVSGRVVRLGEAALDAEKRLAAAVAQAGEAMRQSGSGAGLAPEASQRVERMLPEIADLIRRGIAEQGQAMITRLDAAVGRMTAEADSPVQTLRTAVTDAAGYMAALGDTAVALRRDVIALDTAAREIATASATVVSRVGGAVAHIDTAAACLPDAAAAVVAAAGQAAQTLAEASATLSADRAAMETCARDTGHAAEALQQETVALGNTHEAIRQETVALGATHEALQQQTAALGATHEAIRQETVELGNTHEAIRQETVALGATHEAIHQETAALGATHEAIRQETAALGATHEALQQQTAALGATHEAVRHETAALGAAREAFQRDADALGATRQEIADAEQQAIATVAKTLEIASAHLAAVIADDARQGSANLVQLTTTLDKVAASILDGAASLDAAGQRVVAAGEYVAGQLAADTNRSEALLSALPDVAAELTATAAQLAAVIADAGEARQDSARLVELTTSLRHVAASLMDGTASLDAAGQRVAAAGECVAGQIAADAARGDAVLSALPDVAAELTAAAADLRLETRVLAEAAQQMSTAGIAATSAVTDVAIRAETSAASLDTAGRMMTMASAQLASQIDRHAGVARDAETQASLLPDIATEIAATVARLAALTETWPPESMRTILPEAAARLEAAAPGLDRLDALSLRLENAVAAVAASMTQVQAAAAAVAQAAADSSAARTPNSDHDLAVDSPPAALAATLRGLDDVSSRTERLLRQTEALAEAVVNGRAPGLPLLLADRTPTLLAGIEATTGRLRSVATALALVSDGVPTLERRFG